MVMASIIANANNCAAQVRRCPVTASNDGVGLGSPNFNYT